MNKFFSPKESNKCINPRGKPYIASDYFLRERKQGVLAQQKAENCSFVGKRRNFVTRLLVVYVVTKPKLEHVGPDVDMHV